jgi:hypothetical protein
MRSWSWWLRFRLAAERERWMGKMMINDCGYKQFSASLVVGITRQQRESGKFGRESFVVT